MGNLFHHKIPQSKIQMWDILQRRISLLSLVFLYLGVKSQASTERCNCIHFLLEKQCIYKDIKILSH